jgi:hypothetical protein
VTTAWVLRYSKCGAKYFEEAYSRTVHFLNYTKWQVREEFGLARVVARDPDERGVRIFGVETVAIKAGLSPNSVVTMLSLSVPGDVNLHGKQRIYMTVGHVSLILAAASLARRFSPRYPQMLAGPCSVHAIWWKSHLSAIRARSREIESQYLQMTGRPWRQRMEDANGSVVSEKIKRSGRRASNRIECIELDKGYWEWDAEFMRGFNERENSLAE